MHLIYFKEKEFHPFWHVMSFSLLIQMDLLRWKWGKRIDISKAPGALGRRLGYDKTSQHNIDRWGEVRAADTFPEGVITQSDCVDFMDLATDLGFTGIGVYPEAEPSIMFHLDVRVDRDRGNPALWGAIRKANRKDGDPPWDYVSVSNALSKLQ